MTEMTGERGGGLWDPNNTTAKTVDLFIHSYYAGDSEGGGQGVQGKGGVEET